MPITDGVSEPRGNNLVRIVGRKKHQRVDAAQFLEREAHSFFQGNAALGVLFDQMRNHFGVRFGDEFVAFAAQSFFQFQIIFNDAVVYHDDLPGAVAMRVGIFFGGTAVRGPAGVPDAVGAIDGRFANYFFEIAQLAGGAANFQLAREVDHRDSRRVVAAILELAQALEDYGHNLLRADVADNSTHGQRLSSVTLLA